MTRVFLFPGQSSRYPGMLDAVASLYAGGPALIERASDLLGRDLAKHYRADNPAAFAQNLDVQIGVFLANHLMLQALEAHDVRAEVSAGLSLGEWNHLVHIGAVDFDQALIAVRARGEAYDAGPRGWMAAMQPMDVEACLQVVSQVTDLGPLEIVNYNSPTQQVVAGSREAVEAAVALGEDEHYAQPRIIERQVPMHSTAFATVAERFSRHLMTMKFEPPTRPYIPNRLGAQLGDPSQQDMVRMLSAQVCFPVLWRHTIDHMLLQWPDAVFVEVGPKRVLHDLLSRKWIKRPRFHCDSKTDVAAHFAGVVASLTGAS